MKLDEKKLNRQKICFKNWLNNLSVSFAKAGVILGATGFGKTFILIMAIIDMNVRHADRTTIILVPTTKLKDDWTREKQIFNEKGELVEDFGHIIKHNLLNVRVFVINTYIKYLDWECDLLGIDEIHRVASIDAVHFSTAIKITKYRFGMGLSATVNKKQEEFLDSLGWNIVDRVTPEECEREGYTSGSVTYNLGIPLSPSDVKYNDEINDSFRYYFAKFDHEFELVKACNVGDTKYISVKLRAGTNLGVKSGKEWRIWLARKKGWNGQADHPYSPQNISKYAAQGMSIMRKRKDKWQNMPSKLEYVKALVNKFSNLKTIIFSETSEFADKIAELFPETCLPYHTNLGTLAVRGTEVIRNPTQEDKKSLRKQGYKIKGKVVRQKEAIELFQDPSSKIWQISTVRALDEGFDVKKIQFVLQAAYNSTERQDTQRNGRGKRIDYDDLHKKTLIVNLYMKGTQEEKWLRAKQVGARMVIEVDSIDQINLKTISLYAPPTTETGTLSLTTQ